MLSTAPLLDTSLEGLTLARRGKVRDVYEVTLPSGEAALLIVATDRISAFDYVLGSGIPDKGKVLTQLSGFWFERIGDLVPHHLISLDVDAFPEAARPHADTLRGRTMLARRTEPVPIECVARGYLSGSGWKEYQQSGSVCGVKLPAGLRESDRLPEPIFTPATKADTGHDVNISEDEAGRLAGRELVAASEDADARDLPARRRARGVQGHHRRRHQVRVRPRRRRQPSHRRRPHRRGPDARLVTVLAAATSYEPGHGQPSFDKQYVRDYLEEIRWNKQPPVPSLPDDVVRRTREKYVDAFRRLSGRELQ